MLKKVVPEFVFSIYHYLLALLGAVRYGFPSRSIKVIGVTGTNGKTTTIDLITAILEEAGHKVAVLSSNQFRIGQEERKNELRMTMPGRGFIQKLLREAVDEECQFVVLEVTSEGVAQHRHRFIRFETAVLTNLSPEHIESHGSFEAYREAKGMFFDLVSDTHIINRDDDSFDYFNQFQADRKMPYSLDKVEADMFGTRFTIDGTSFQIKLLGGFNAHNALAAIRVGQRYNIDLETASSALSEVRGVPGRMELVISEPFSVVVDYAFTPNALEKVYSFLSSEMGATMTCVLGACGGGRDKWKRPVLGGLADRYCDRVIVTNEDPYDEDPEEIIDQVIVGKAEKVLNRREAIQKALEGAKDNEVVVITGKGAEPSIVEKGQQIPWDDREVVREEFKKLKTK